MGRRRAVPIPRRRAPSRRRAVTTRRPWATLRRRAATTRRRWAPTPPRILYRGALFSETPPHQRTLTLPPRTPSSYGPNASHLGRVVIRSPVTTSTPQPAL